MNLFTYSIDPQYSKPVAYFSMEFAIDQSLKIYSGGLGFLAGSHLRSAFELGQQLVGIGMLWKYGYYDQQRSEDGLMVPAFLEKQYSFLHDTGIILTVNVHGAPVHVKAWKLDSETFGTAPLFLLSTDIPENDFLSRTITHRLYDSNELTRIAQSIVLGIGGAMLCEALNYPAETFHMNEGHSLPLNFFLYARYKNLDEIKKRVIFTTHTPEMAGNEEHTYESLKEMSFFYHMQDHEVRKVLDMEGERFNYTLAALKFAGKANGVSRLHAGVAREMWGTYRGICEITSITNAQNKNYWKDSKLDDALQAAHHDDINSRKRELKAELFKCVADQCGKLFHTDVLTIVWSRRFAGYKRADLMMYDWNRFLSEVNNNEFPVQIIWAGKPYPEDSEGISLFNKLISQTRNLPNCAVLTGYELGLSALLKKGSDVWLNTPRMFREASGTSGMTAAMNGSLNVSMPDGWIPEFAKDGENSFLISQAGEHLSQLEKDRTENKNLMDVLQSRVIPLYYQNKDRWYEMVVQAAHEIVPQFDSARMVREYYELLYTRIG